MLGIDISPNVRLDELKQLMNSHDAFKNASEISVDANCRVSNLFLVIKTRDDCR